MWLERLKVEAAVLALVGFVAMLLGIAWADRAEKKRITFFIQQIKWLIHIRKRKE